MSKRSFLVFLSLTISIIFALGDVSALLAQEASSEEFTLEEITVTAQKRAENQQKVPIAMEVISADIIREQAKNDLDEVLSGISNTIIEKSQEGYRITIRGVTDNSEAYKGQSMAPPAVAVNIDGIYSNRKDTGSGFYDLERVEVLYGPQSTIYMSNSPGGIVNVVSASPKTDKYEASGLLEYGSYNLLHTEGAMNVPIGSQVAMRAAFSTSVRDGYLTNGLDDEDTKSARVKVLYQPSDVLSFVVTGETSRNAGKGFGSGVVPFDNGDGHWYVADGQGGYVQDGKVTNPWTGTDFEKTTSNNQIMEKIYGVVTWDTSAGTITLTPAYTRRNGNSSFIFDDPSPDPPTESFMVQSAEEKAFEFRMTSPADFMFKWIAGATYYDSYDRGLDRSTEYIETGWGRMSDREMTNTNKAFYLNVTFPVTERFRATGGYRKSWDKMVSDNEEIRGSPDLPPGELAYMPEVFIMENPGTPDYKAGLEYDLSTNTMLYADYATSYRVQGMGGGPPGTVTTNEPERLKAYTLGAKNRFFENKLQLNAAAYYYDYSNYRAGGNDFSVWLVDVDGDNQPDPGRDTGEMFGQRNTNSVGDGRMIGLDLSINTVLTQRDMVSLTASFMKSEWTDLVLDYYYDYYLVPGDDGTPDTVYLPYEDLAGTTMMASPPFTINLTYDHNFSLANGGALKASVIVKYKAAYDLSWREIDYPINYQEAFHTEDFNLAYNNPDGKWTLSGYVKNAFDYAEKRSVLNMGGNKLLSIGNPRTYGGVLSVKF
jgi:iron complex outermembrane recepter protein